MLVTQVMAYYMIGLIQPTNIFEVPVRSREFDFKDVIKNIILINIKL